MATFLLDGFCELDMARHGCQACQRDVLQAWVVDGVTAIATWEIWNGTV